MPWKLIFFILCLIIAAVFTGLNLGNSCDINFGFSRLEKVPVFLTILFSFAAGILITLPFVFIGRHKRKNAESKKTTENAAAQTAHGGPVLYSEKDSQ